MILSAKRPGPRDWPSPKPKTQTLALGHALAAAEWGAWNERRLAAEAKGEAFDEPTPATLRE